MKISLAEPVVIYSLLYILIPAHGWRTLLPKVLMPMYQTTVIVDTIRLASVSTDQKQSKILELTRNNVESVLDRVRPYLESDGGNVELVDIDEGIVKLKLQGACRSCPSSVNTMKFGLEKALKESIPLIKEVINVDDVQTRAPPTLSILGVDAVLNQLRPFIAAAGGKVRIINLETSDSSDNAASIVSLQLEGTCAQFTSIKKEIESRIHKQFRTTSSTLTVAWVES